MFHRTYFLFNREFSYTAASFHGLTGVTNVTMGPVKESRGTCPSDQVVTVRCSRNIFGQEATDGDSIGAVDPLHSR